MQSLILTEDHAHDLKKIIGIFIDSLRLLIQQGSLKIDFLTLEWNPDVIRITLKAPPPQEDGKEEQTHESYH